MQTPLQTNPRLDLADQYVRLTNTNVFLTGKAGTGKTTFLKNIKANSPKRMVIVAPTGVAAINAGGVTIHSFFQLSFGPNIPIKVGVSKPFERKFNSEKIKAIRAIDILVIDEISMVRADILDAIDEVLRRYRDRNKPFGGVQLLMIGDLHQLSPVIKDDEWAMLRPYYASVYFFESKALNLSQFITIELTHIFRQADEVFINLLNKVRDKNLDAESAKLLNSRYLPNFVPEPDKDYITLTSHNNAASTINQAKMQDLKGKAYSFLGEITDDFPESMYPNELNLELKIGAQVMFVKNDLNIEKRFFNGKLGEITKIVDNIIHVKCKDERDEILVSKAIWGNIKYVLDENKVMQETVIGTFSQYPIKAAWAITIHKSQGLTFDRAIIDAASSFAHGQVYVALSRCKTFEGLVLSTPITAESVKSDHTILSFDKETEKQDLSETALLEAKRITQANFIRDLFDFEWVKFGLANIYKTIEMNQKQLPVNTLAIFTNIFNEYKLEVGEITGKFSRQLETILIEPTLPEENNVLQERIKKGCEYLYPKLNDLVYIPLSGLDLECDNNEIETAINKVWEANQKAIFEKLQLFKLGENGFDSTQYLKAKANSAIDFDAEKKKQNSKSGNKDQVTGNKDLTSQLKAWRDMIAIEKNVEKYMVLPQKTIQNLVEELPGNKTALAKIGGLGPAKLNQYGDEIIDIILNYCEQNGVEANYKGKIKEKVAKKSITVGSTHQVSYDLYIEGKSIAEIALIRQFAETTIEGHLSEFVRNGKLEIEKVMDGKKVSFIREFMLENPMLKNKELKEGLGDDYSYGEIKMVWNSMNIELI